LNIVSDETPIQLHKGDNVAIHEGVFKGYEGVFDIQLSGADRVRVLLSLMDDQFIPVELPASRIHRIN
jgi:transcription antitermination factor NusG